MIFRVCALPSSKAMLRDLCMRLRLERDFHLTLTTTAAAFKLIYEFDHLKVCKAEIRLLNTRPRVRGIKILT